MHAASLIRCKQTAQTAHDPLAPNLSEWRASIRRESELQSGRAASERAASEQAASERTSEQQGGLGPVSLAALPERALLKIDNTRRAVTSFHGVPQDGLIPLLRSLTMRNESRYRTNSDATCQFPSERPRADSSTTMEGATPHSARIGTALTPRQQRWCRRIGLRIGVARAWAEHADHPVATIMLFAAATIVSSIIIMVMYAVGTDELYMTCLSAAIVCLCWTLMLAYWTIGPSYFSTKLGMSHIVCQLLYVAAAELPLPFRSLECIPFKNRILFLVRNNNYSVCRRTAMLKHSDGL
jgi:hypothetical protein